MQEAVSNGGINETKKKKNSKMPGVSGINYPFVSKFFL